MKAAASIQLDALTRKHLETFYVKKDDLSKYFGDSDCLGIQLGSIDTLFREGQIELSTYFKDAKTKTKLNCDKFDE